MARTTPQPGPLDPLLRLAIAAVLLLMTAAASLSLRGEHGRHHGKARESMNGAVLNGPRDVRFEQRGEAGAPLRVPPSRPSYDRNAI
jgi:hypothetical protein